jgi:hypothetical protein
LENCRTTTQTATPGVLDTPDGSQILGLVYQTDYDASQEYGISDLRNALCGPGLRDMFQKPRRRNHVAVFTDVNAVAFSDRPFKDVNAARKMVWGEPFEHHRRPGRSEYAEFFDQNLPYAQEWPNVVASWDTITELRTKAKNLGIDGPLPRTKQALIDAIRNASATHNAAAVPDRWPAWFRTALVLRADRGITAEIVDAIREAALADSLAVGSASGPFHTGLFLYDRRDESKALIDTRNARWDWYEARMVELAPVRAALEANGHRFFFLGNPREGGWNTAKGQECQQPRYWLNGMGRTRIGRQPGGWYTLEELRDEAFLDD